jgi:hypothetical protein
MLVIAKKVKNIAEFITDCMLQLLLLGRSQCQVGPTLKMGQEVL